MLWVCYEISPNIYSRLRYEPDDINFFMLSATPKARGEAHMHGTDIPDKIRFR